MGIDHKATYVEFARCEIESGGPDPHLRMVAHHMADMALHDAAWAAACYVGPYEATTGLMIWKCWPLATTLTEGEAFTAWIAEHWKGLQIRRERRAARTPEKMAESLRSCALWVGNDLEGIRHLPYEQLWKSAEPKLRYFGRYAIIKVLEALHAGGVVIDGATDIRPAGGWSPRLALSLIYPEHEELLNNGGNQKEVLASVNSISDALRLHVSGALGREVSHFEHEVLLCNYRQAIERKYPGRPLDTDLKYRRVAEAYWATQQSKHWGFSHSELLFPFYATRAALFPHTHLGEIGGWEGTRDELGTTFAKHGYFWSDSLYDYKATADLANPVRR